MPLRVGPTGGLTLRHRSDTICVGYYMRRWARAHPCVAYSLVGLLVGVSALAWGQTQPEPATAPVADPMASLLTHILSGSGLPAVLAALGYWLGRNGITITIRLSDDDRALLRRDP